jgi:hypothetical protein
VFQISFHPYTFVSILINLLKGIEDPSTYGGRFADESVIFYKYGKKNIPVPGRVRTSFTDLLDVCIFAYSVHRQDVCDFKQTLQANGKKAFTWLKNLHQCKYCLILALIYIIVKWFFIYLIF